MDEHLLLEARQDIRSIKDSLSSIDKNLSLSTQRLEDISVRTIELEKRVDRIDGHVQFVNAVFRMASILGAIALFFVEIVPFVYNVIR